MREENSSSQNADLVISGKKRGADGTTWKVFLSDGSSFLLPADCACRLNEGDPVDEELSLYLKSADELCRAHVKGYELCARREHSVLQLERKLAVRGFSRDAVRNTTEMLVHVGALDDARYASVWLSNPRRTGNLSRLQICMKLKEAGISEEIIRETLSDMYSRDNELAALEKLCGKLVRRRSATRKKCITWLRARGFSSRDILKTLESNNIKD